jgi:hypothetical protein
MCKNQNIKNSPKYGKNKVNESTLEQYYKTKEVSQANLFCFIVIETFTYLL